MSSCSATHPVIHVDSVKEEAADLVVMARLFPGQHGVGKEPVSRDVFIEVDQQERAVWGP